MLSWVKAVTLDMPNLWIRKISQGLTPAQRSTDNEAMLRGGQIICPGKSTPFDYPIING